MEFKAGDRVGDYEIVQLLGAGGMGKVYKVRNLISDRIEAIKVLLPNLEENADLADRFLREIKVQATLEHPNIASLHTAQRIDNQLVMVLEFVEGITLDKLLATQQVTLYERLGYVAQVLRALEYAHARGIVHRDIKPQNIMVTPSGVAKLMDFGIAKMMEERHLTRTGSTLGSLYYMSPEQVRGAQLDGRSDLYSLGITLYEVVTGKRPYEGENEYAVMSGHLTGQPRPPKELAPDIPVALNDLILMSLSKEPAQRFQTAAAFRNALERTAGLPLTPLAASPTVRPAPEAQPAGAIPTPGPQPQYAQPAAAGAPPVPVASSRRGIYMLAGSLVTVAVLVVAALQAPKWFGAQAQSGNQPAGRQSAPAGMEGQYRPVVPAPSGPENPDAGSAAVPTPGAVASTPAAATAAASAPPVSPTPAVAHPATQTTRPSTGSRTNPLNASTSAATQIPLSTGPQTEPPAANTANSAANAAAPNRTVALPTQEAPAVNTGELAALRNRLMLMSTRVGTARRALQKLEAEQSRSGLGMRGDMKSAENRLIHFLDEAQNALQDRNAEGAKTALDRAERELGTLESFLGL